METARLAEKRGFQRLIDKHIGVLNSLHWKVVLSLNIVLHNMKYYTSSSVCLASSIRLQHLVSAYCRFQWYILKALDVACFTGSIGTAGGWVIAKYGWLGHRLNFNVVVSVKLQFYKIWRSKVCVPQKSVSQHSSTFGSLMRL